MKTLERLFNPIVPVGARKNVLVKFSEKNIFKKVFEGEMIRAQPTTLFQIFCKFIKYAKVIFKTIIDPDDLYQLEP